MSIVKDFEVKSKMCNNLYKLVYNNKIVGIRVEVMRPDELGVLTRNYFDINVDCVVDSEVKSFLVKVQSKLKSLNLVQRGTDLVSELELSKNINIQEFEDVSQINQVLRTFFDRYEV